MSQMRDLWVRSEYIAEDHPIRWCVAATTVMMAMFWLVSRNLVFAAFFSAFVNVAMTYARRSARGRHRWVRWAARHPRPGGNA